MASAVSRGRVCGSFKPRKRARPQPGSARSSNGGAIDPPEPVRRYQRERPGELFHLDIKKLCRFGHPSHRVTGSRTGCRNRGAGWNFVHVAVNDATRLAYVEGLGDERKDTTTAFLLRAHPPSNARNADLTRR